MLDLNNLPDTATAEEVALLIAKLAPTIGVSGDPPDVRTLRLWRTKQLVTIDGRRFTKRNILEVLAMLSLQQQGWTQQAAAKQARSSEETHLLHILQLEQAGASDVPHLSSGPDPFVTLQWLASAILTLYNSVRQGAIVGHTHKDKTGGFDGIPPSLRKAQALLGSHYFYEGEEDRAASVHQLLYQCTSPLHTWAPRALVNLQAGRYREAILIDATYHGDPVPSEDCETIAETMGGAKSLSDLIEHRLHERLRETLKDIGTVNPAGADQAYTTIREFVGRHPLASRHELDNFSYQHPELPDQAIMFVRSLYVPVHAWDARNGRQVRRCPYCHGLITAQQGDWQSASCCLAGCRDDHPTSPAEDDAELLPLADSRIARPEVLKFWIDPAREELRLYDALLKASYMHERDVQLYPQSDKCDVALDVEAGVDVKDYHDAYLLAHRINSTHLGVFEYPDAILAIAKRRWKDTYKAQLLEHLSADRKSRLKIMSVTDAISYLITTYGRAAGGGGRDA
jgi:hypothetical protein